MSDRPLVLHIDDQPDDLRTWQDAVNAVGTVQLEVRHPRDVSNDDLAKSRLVLVDVRLDTWQERDELTALSLQPANGLALLAVLQEHAYAASKDKARAFALYTAVVKEIARGLVPRPHIIARAHSLEWVFDKTQAANARVSRVAELALAVRALPSPWPGESLATAGKALREWLALPNDVTWADSAWRSIINCRPPLHEFAEHTHGIGVLRWMLHRILPYPCFLLDDAHLAARLRVQTDSLREALEGPLKEVFQPAFYGGELKEFLGRRWWRSAIDALVFDLAKDDPADLTLLHKKLQERAPALKTFGGQVAFAVLDAEYQTKDELAGPDDVVQILPDDWPPFADSAWALRADLDANPELKAIVVLSPDEGGGT
jgi:hypothetical protein